MEVVTELPTIGENNIIYLIARTNQETSNIYDEYIYVNSAWEKIGSTDVDLTNYALKNEIPIKLSQLTNDSGFITDYTETDPTVPNHVKNITQENINDWSNLIGIKELENSSSKSDLSQGIYFCTNNVNINIGSSTRPKNLPLKTGDLIFIVRDVLIRICVEKSLPMIYFTNNQ